MPAKAQESPQLAAFEPLLLNQSEVVFKTSYLKIDVIDPTLSSTYFPEEEEQINS